MIEALRRAAVAMNAAAETEARKRLPKRVLRFVGLLGLRPAAAPRNVERFQSVADLHAAETATWVSPDDLMAGHGGPFDALDLRHWLALAERAGVPAVPAREIMRLDAAEMDLASGPSAFEEGPLLERARRALAGVTPVPGEGAAPRVEPDSLPMWAARLEERLFSAMDGVPEGWMVRTNRTGGSELKAMAGMGVAGPTAPAARFGPELEVGPGWVRSGNRRRVNASDGRTVRMAATGPEGGACTFLARPWVEAARYFVGDDPTGTAASSRARGSGRPSGAPSWSGAGWWG
jgi:hypothetical protein